MPENDKIYPLKLNKDYYVVTANDLIKGKQKMTLREAQLLYITMSQVVKEDKELKTYTTSVTNLASFMGIDANSLYRDLEHICTDLLKRVVKIQTTNAVDPRDKKWKVFQWVTYAAYENGKLTLKLNDELKPFLIDLVSHYSQILLGTLCAFKSYYTSRLYQLIVCEIGEHSRSCKEEWEFTCEQLRDFFQIEPHEYARPHDLIKKTIKPSLRELNDSDFAVIWNVTDLRGPGKGRPLAGISFKAAVFKNREEKDRFVSSMKLLYDETEFNNVIK